jgi:hypothetical protein
LTLQEFKTSNRVDFPQNKTYVSFILMLSDKHKTTERSVYGLFDYLGDIGGLVEILKLIMGVFAFPLSKARIKAIISNRIYHIT